MKQTNIFSRWICLAMLLGCVGVSWGQTVITSNGGTLASGNYVLTGNTQIKSTLLVRNGSNVTIDLAGFVLSGTGIEYVIRVEGGGTLTINDSDDIGHEGSLNINPHNILKWHVEDGDQLFYGGTIYNDYVDANTRRSGILVEGTCTANGVNIMGCYSPQHGAAVTVSSSGKFTMNDGQISYNYSGLGASGYSGVVYGEPKNANAQGAVLEFENTTISHNSVGGHGGAICAYKVSLDDCKIEYNTATYNGGGLYIRGEELNLIMKNNTVVRHNKALGIASVTENGEGNVSNGCGGGIFIGRDTNGTCTIENSTIDSNYSSVGGGGIYSLSKTTITNSSITKNLAMYSEEQGKPSYNSGRGGGFYFAGNQPSGEDPFKPEFILENTAVKENACMYYGGGGQICVSGILILRGSTAINGNEAILAGAGGVHVTADAILNFENGEISGNTAHGVGGAIHSSYTCKLNLSGGTISGNKSLSRGGGVHVNTGGNLELKGTIITNNEVVRGNKKKYATVDIDGHTYTATVDNTANFTEDIGYGGGVLIDAGTCTMTAGELTNNKAEVGGGGIALVMLNMPSPGSTHFEDVRVVEFELQSGTIENNTTNGDGAGVYIMENKMGPKLQGYIDNGTLPSGVDSNSDHFQGLLNGISKATIAGGSLANNVATGNGGALLVNGNVTMTDGTFTKNEAQNGGGICIIGGTVGITKGNIIENTATNYGGGIYVENNDPNAVITLSGEGVFEKNEAQAGGGMAVKGPFTFNFAGTLQNNNAVNGGGIYLLKGTDTTKGATLNFNGGFIRNNTATGTPKLTNQTAYQKDVNAVTGVGGGVFMADYTTLDFDVANTLGFYGNRATNAADDIFANGNGTSVILPAVDDMTLTDFSVPAGELFWAEDYYSHYENDSYESDANYTNGTNGLATGLTPSHNLRYQFALQNLKRGHITKVEAVTFNASYKDKYVCLALGYQIFYVTIKKTGLQEGESAFFHISSTKTDANIPNPYITMLLTGSKEGSETVEKKVALPEGEWKVKENTAWSWSYTSTELTEITKEVNTDNIEFLFSNVKKDDTATGLHDEDIVVNGMGKKEDTSADYK